MNLIIVLYYCISVPYLLIHYKKYYITPSLVFISMQLLMFNGIVISQNLYLSYYVEKLVFMYFIALIFFIFGVTIVNIAISIKRKTVNKKDTHQTKEYKDTQPSNYQSMVIFSLIGFSIIVCSWFFSRAGINIFVESVTSLLSGEKQILSSERKNFTDIPGVGYVYQFRTVILPILNIYLIVGQKSKVIKRIGLVLLPITTSFLLGTGQRNAFVFILLFSFVYLLLLKKGFKLNISKIKMFILLSISVVLLAVLTITNGRVAMNSENVFVGALSSLVDRIVGVNSRSALNAFIYIDSQPTVWGYDWFMMLADILPGKIGYTSVASITYYSLYGTYRGTEPPDIWGSAYYNWSWIGVIVFPLLLGMIYQMIYVWYRKQMKTKLLILIYAGLCTFLGIWISDSPMALFNNGTVTIFFMYLLLRFKIVAYANYPGYSHIKVVAKRINHE